MEQSHLKCSFSCLFSPGVHSNCSVKSAATRALSLQVFPAFSRTLISQFRLNTTQISGNDTRFSLGPVFLCFSFLRENSAREKSGKTQPEEWGWQQTLEGEGGTRYTNSHAGSPNSKLSSGFNMASSISKPSTDFNTGSPNSKPVFSCMESTGLPSKPVPGSAPAGCKGAQKMQVQGPALAFTLSLGP